MNAIAPLDPLRLPLAGTRLIEASAGTGKTWTIAALYLRLVLGHGGGTPLLPAQILVMTFTKAATGELRERIRERLAEAAAAFRGQRDADDFLRALIDDHPADLRARAARQLELAAQWMDEAAVFTIHGWCQRMLAQHAFDSGEAATEGGIADEAELLAEAVRDYWRRFFFPLGRDAAALVAALWRTPGDLQREVAPLLSQPRGSLRLEGRPVPALGDPAALLDMQADALRSAEEHVRALWREQGAGIAALLRDALRDGVLNGSSYKPALFDGDHAALDAWTNDGAPPGEKTLERHGAARLASATRKGQATPAHAFFDAVDRLRALRAEAGGLAPLLLAHAAPWIAHRLDEARRQRAQLGYDDMLRRLDAALHGANGDALARTLATQYPVALVDEFQDTDPLQWRILQRIHDGRDGHALLLIGDPKQAIYGFRGADIHTYLRARAAAAQPTWTLDTNYRSTAALVAAVNRVFEHASTQPHGAFGFGDALPFTPVRANGRSERLLLDGAPMPALRIAVQTSEAALSAGAWRDGLAAHAAAQLVQWLDAAQAGRCGFAGDGGTWAPLRPGDIAILVRDRHDAAAMRQALRQRGLAHVYLSDNQSVYATAEAADLLPWLHACAMPGSDRAIRAALATPGMDRSLAELDRLNTDEPYREACGEHFRQLHELWRRHGVLAMLHELLHRFDLPSRLLARADGERTLTNLLHLAELLQQAAAGLDGEHALIRHLAAQIARPGRGEAAAEQIVRLESEAALIKVVTIHKSKGLEYPLVLLPFACGFRETKRGSALVWHDRDGRPHLDLRPDDAAWRQAEHERLQEDLRLLYVALTRARHACWLGAACPRDGQKKESGLHRSAFGYVLAGGRVIEPASLPSCVRALAEGHPHIRVSELDAPASERRYQAPTGDGLARPARTCALPPHEPWWIASYSALAHAGDHAVRPAPETAGQATLAEAVAAPEAVATPAAIPQGIHAFPRGAMPGTFLHDLLEACAHESFARAAAGSATVRDTLARRCQARGWQAWIKPLAQWLPALLHTPLPLPDGGAMPLAALADPARYRAELEFWFEANHVDAAALDRLASAHTLDGAARPPLPPNLVNGLLKGFIDLVFEHDGRWYVADYKSNWLGNDAGAYTADAMRASVLQARYDLQYAIYTLALHRQLQARLPGYDYDRHIGGVLYLYLRGVDADGHGVHVERLPRALVEAMDVLFAAGETHR
ncbi:exodeoxyribonuclease V subunit beta [Fulvimonas sp. R45]|uniref:exodeoxyribonuclease V subunit beta n=1 Tax=Fulvimonas sp. R45 TaxID=3045937 RepID=UPI00265FFE6E|nr:exodeoxyribonuclease V subunit beta [Fulvimonas sp. R45]MDO1527497.1 exodeoxyribonuclease V subunit beta [Fulvimonas sp. R45]